MDTRPFRRFYYKRFIFDNPDGFNDSNYLSKRKEVKRGRKSPLNPLDTHKVHPMFVYGGV